MYNHLTDNIWELHQQHVNPKYKLFLQEWEDGWKECKRNTKKCIN